MKWILISVALNLQMVYPDQDVCMTALKQVKTQDMAAICIPAGEDQADLKIDRMFDQFMNMVTKMQKLEK
jgi:hypothetical protein